MAIQNLNITDPTASNPTMKRYLDSSSVADDLVALSMEFSSAKRQSVWRVPVGAAWRT